MLIHHTNLDEHLAEITIKILDGLNIYAHTVIFIEMPTTYKRLSSLKQLLKRLGAAIEKETRAEKIQMHYIHAFIVLSELY